MIFQSLKFKALISAFQISDICYFQRPLLTKIIEIPPLN